MARRLNVRKFTRLLLNCFLVVGMHDAWAGPTPFDPLDESMALFPLGVQWCINWLIVIGLSSILFVWKYIGARWVLGAYIANHSVALGVGWFLVKTC